MSFRLTRLKKEAISDPKNAEKQAAFLKELVKNGRYRDVISHVERADIPKNEQVIAAYLASLQHTNKLTQERVAKILSESRAESSVTNGGLLLPARVTIDSSSNPIQVEPIQRFTWGKLARTVIFLGIFLLYISYLSGSMDPTKALGGTSSKAVTHSNTKFSDVKGCDEAKEQLVDLVEYLKNPKKFTSLGGHLPKGVLLSGDPGTGKTLLAKAVAGEAGVPFFYAAGSEFDEVFVGVGAKRVRALFAEAKKQAPCIIFLDEIETIGASRKKTINYGYRDGTINQLLTELDGFKENTGVIVIAATNFPESLDAALTRPGRFDKIVTVSPPDKKGRMEILELYFKKVALAPDVNIETLARATPGFTGADLQNIVNIGALKAAKQGLSAITMSVMEDALDDVRMGVVVRSKAIPLENRKLTAYHEAGHALVSLYTPGSDPIHKATILPRGSALGMVAHLPPADSYSVTKQQLLAQIAVAMAGRAAEEMIYGPLGITGGASSDFEAATRKAQAMVARLGMGETTGFQVFKEPEATSEEAKKAINAEVESILKKQYDYAKSLLKSRERELHYLANALLEHETLDEEQIRAVISGQKIKTH